jgi:methionine-rich copper-binding protein CopC
MSPSPPGGSALLRSPLPAPRWVLAVSVLAGASLAPAVAVSPAHAHARLEVTDPAAGQTITAPVESIHLTYSEPIEESFSGVQVFDPAGARVDEGSPVIEGADTTVAVGEFTLPGTYSVVFRVIGADGHPVESRYTFIYQPAVTSPPDPPTPTPVPDPPATSEGRATAEASPTPTPTPTPTAASAATGTDSATEDVASDDPQEAPPPVQQVDPASRELEDAGPGTDVGLLVWRVLDYLALVVLLGGLVAAAWVFRGEPPSAPSQRRARRIAAVGGAAVAVAAAGIFTFGLSSAAEPLPQVLSIDVHDLHVWTLTSGMVVVSAHLLSAAGHDTHDILHAAHRVLRDTHGVCRTPPCRSKPPRTPTAWTTTETW